MSYNHLEIEKKWQKYWLDNKTYATKDNEQEKMYILDMFPYPSGAGLHVGHPEGYTASDIYSRFKRMQGYNVLHPIGWDAFGLPAEQYAIKTGNHPQEFTLNNIETFKGQLQSLGFSYDWDKEINTTDPEFFKWTQWIFMQLFKKGLAEIKEIEVNYCPELGTVLANEEIVNVDGKMFSEVGNFEVFKKPMKQWVLKITEYADRLLEDLEGLDWPESVKDMQRNWIGRSKGFDLTLTIKDSAQVINVFTTRIDTLYGVTYVVLAPEHELVNQIMTSEQKDEVLKYQEIAKSKTDLERMELNKERTGVFTGSYALNPLTNELVPIWISDYVIASYGSGAVMAVPAHDQRDYEFAKKYDLPIKQVVEGDIEVEAYEGDGKHINSDLINGLLIDEAKQVISEHLIKEELGEHKINYKLRDWIFARQRYWGEPFPVVHYEDGSIELLDESELPLTLPEISDFKPSGNGESPLAKADEWLEVIREDGVKGRRDTNTMPQWAGSCWYYIGYIIKTKDGYLPLDQPQTQDLINQWLPVDLYIGGAEHAVLHLLYARFWHKVLYDCGVVTTKEPFQRLFNQGMILGENGVKMSKSLGNVINPNEIVESHGADSLRLYEMFMGPLDQTKKWSTEGLDGARRFIDRVYRLFTKIELTDDNDGKLDLVYNQTVKKITECYEKLHFNVAISQMMIFINEAYKTDTMPIEYAKGFLKIFSCIAPHVSNELYEELQFGSLDDALWPNYDENKLKANDMTIVVQVNGKKRAELNVAFDISEEAVIDLALNDDKVKPHLEEKNVVKTIYVKNRLVNIVVK